MLLALALHASTARAGTPAGFGGTPGVINENTPHYDLEPLYHDGKAQLSAGAGVPASRSARGGGATRPAAPRPSSVATAGRGRALDAARGPRLSSPPRRILRPSPRAKGATMASSPGGTSPSLRLRRGLPADAEACGRICYDAFRAIAERHGFPPDFPSPADAVATVGRLLAHPGFHAIVAESDGRVVGSNFLDERSTIAGLGPITVDTGVQNAGVGRRLMLAAIERVRERQAPGVRLLQSAYHNRSLSLYTTLGFNVREPVVTLQGAPIGAEVPGYRVSQASEYDVEAGNRVCVSVHGHDRSGELLDAIREGSARVVEHGGRITGYTTGIAFFAHSVGESNEDLKALIAAAPEFSGPGFLLPARNAELYRWCLAHGLRVVQVMTLMTLGLYNEPAGAYLPSILY